MHDYLWLIPSILVTVAASYMVYSIATRGFKGSMFGYKITDSAQRRIEYRQQGSKHTIRLHRLGDNDLYGLEIGRWATIFGETSPIVIPREQLLLLRDMITEFAEQDRKSETSEGN